MAHRILIVGADDVLVQTRALVLSSRYETESVDPQGLMNRLQEDQFNLLLVCYSTETETADKLIFQAHKHYPRLCIVRLLAAWGPEPRNPHAHSVIRITFEPHAWLDEIDRLLEKNKAQPFQ